MPMRSNAPTAAATQPSAAPDYDAIKARQQAMWASGDFGEIGVRLQIVGESLCEAVDLRSVDHVLDVAAGNGNASLAAARRYADVVATDYVPGLLEQARRRAEAERLPIHFQVADAEALPFADARFDVALSTYGVMFAPNQTQAAAELLRVVKPGGRIGLASWTPEGFIGELFRVVGAFAPPPPGVRSPAFWGSESGVGELFDAASAIRAERKLFMFRYLSIEHWIEVFRTYYGPLHKAFGALDAAGQAALDAELRGLLQRYNRTGRALVIPGEYLEVVVTK